MADPDDLEAEADGAAGVYTDDVEPDDDATIEMRPLFPDGQPSDKWTGVFQ